MNFDSDSDQRVAAPKNPFSFHSLAKKSKEKEKSPPKFVFSNSAN